MFWIACPAAPFTRLSMAATTTPRPVDPSKWTPISQKFVRATDRKKGRATKEVAPAEIAGTLAEICATPVREPSRAASRAS